jgi:hypothetical protein
MHKPIDIYKPDIIRIYNWSIIKKIEKIIVGHLIQSLEKVLMD